VLDASAALAYFFHEPGWDLVRDLLDSQQVAMSTVNLSEVVARLTDAVG
jgi:PIN domain nuclease of toxin-antitoxin system